MKMPAIATKILPSKKKRVEIEEILEIMQIDTNLYI